jgi:hypothetical protein
MLRLVSDTAALRDHSWRAKAAVNRAQSKRSALAVFAEHLDGGCLSTALTGTRDQCFSKAKASGEADFRLNLQIASFSAFIEPDVAQH